MQVTINDLVNLPHHDGQVVLQAERDDFKVDVRCGQDVYYVFGIIREAAGGKWTRLAAPCSTVEEATALARRLRRARMDFNTILGQAGS